MRLAASWSAHTSCRAGYYDAYYNRARKVRTLIKQDFEEAFAEGVDAILTPATPSAAFELGKTFDDPVQMYLNDVFTVTVNLAGLPGLAVPAGLDAQGLPLGLQLIGKPWQEGELLNVGLRSRTIGRIRGEALENGGNVSKNDKVSRQRHDRYRQGRASPSFSSQSDWPPVAAARPPMMSRRRRFPGPTGLAGTAGHATRRTAAARPRPRSYPRTRRQARGYRTPACPCRPLSSPVAAAPAAVPPPEPRDVAGLASAAIAAAEAETTAPVQPRPRLLRR